MVEAIWPRTVPMSLSSRNSNSGLGTRSLARYTLLYDPSINHRSLNNVSFAGKTSAIDLQVHW